MHAPTSSMMSRVALGGLLVFAMAASACDGDESGSDVVAPDADTAETGASDVDASDVSDSQSSGCPAEIPWAAVPSTCDPQVVSGDCGYPAPGCAAGVKPDNRCRCVAAVGPSGDGHWQCDEPFQTCLPVPSEAAPGAPTRELPPERVPAACPAPTNIERAATCTTFREGNRAAECTDATGCASGELCLAGYDFNASRCGCFPVGCGDDTDCASGQACLCGNTDPTQACGGWFGPPCGHTCVAAGCRASSDCGAGGICSPSPDRCFWGIERYACHNPDNDECLSDDECFGSNRCRYDATASRWACEGMVICD